MYLKSSRTTAAKAAAKSAPRLAAVFLAAALALSAFCVPVWAAADKPVVNDASGAALADNGLTFISADTDVFVSPAPGAVYYYAFAKGSVDVYYAGAAGNPSGSYFDGPLTNGAYVTTIDAGVNSQSGTPVSAAGGYKITVPKPAQGQSVSLYVVAYAGGAASGVFTHTFAYEDAPISVTDGGSVVFANGGTTVTDKAVDAHVTGLQAGTQYYYSFAQGAAVDVYYAGANGNPSGSYFDGPLTNGAYVTTINSSGVTGTLLTADANGDYIIPVPAPSVWGTPNYMLTITAAKDGVSAVVFTHTFKFNYQFTANFGTRVTAEFDNYSDGTYSLKAILAIYDAAGKLVYIESKPFTAAAGQSAPIAFSADNSKYQAGAYRYAVYCWDGNYAPMSPVLDFHSLPPVIAVN